MRVAVIYRPREAPPMERLPRLLQGMADWVQRYRDRMETIEFFAGGGGLAVSDVQNSSELQLMIADHPFTPFYDVEIQPVVDVETSLKTLQSVFAAAQVDT